MGFHSGNVNSHCPFSGRLRVRFEEGPGKPDVPEFQSGRNYRGKLFNLQLELFCLQLSFFAYSPLRLFLDALSHCKERSSNCEQKS